MTYPEFFLDAPMALVGEMAVVDYSIKEENYYFLRKLDSRLSEVLMFNVLGADKRGTF